MMRAHLTVTTQAAEKIYRARSLEPARIASRLRLASGCELHWLPQETILFDRARLQRSLEVEMVGSARLLAVESLVLGRAAHGEQLKQGSFEDRWHIRRDGRLVWADRFLLAGDIAGLGARRATLDGAGALATVLLVCPNSGRWLEPVRAWLSGLTIRAGVTRRGAVLVVRLLAPTGDALRGVVAGLLVRWRSELAGEPAPRSRASGEPEASCHMPACPRSAHGVTGRQATGLGRGEGNGSIATRRAIGRTGGGGHDLASRLLPAARGIWEEECS